MVSVKTHILGQSFKFFESNSAVSDRRQINAVAAIINLPVCKEIIIDPGSALSSVHRAIITAPAYVKACAFGF